jgi:hypothetical protein
MLDQNLGRVVAPAVAMAGVAKPAHVRDHADDEGRGSRGSATDYARSVRQDPESLVGQLVDVEGRGIGMVTGVRKSMGKSTQHLVAFRDNPTVGPEAVLLQKLGKDGKARGLKFRVVPLQETGRVDTSQDVAAAAAAPARATSSQRPSSPSTAPSNPLAVLGAAGRQSSSRARALPSAASSKPLDTSEAGRQSASRARIIESRRPDEMWAEAPLRDEEQFSDLRYTGCLVENPISFTDEGYALAAHTRCASGAHQSVKIMLCVTVYNECAEELQRTLASISNNMRTQAAREGDNAWKSVLLCIICDGRDRVDPGLLRFASSIGIYDDNMLATRESNVQAHLFEFTPQMRDSGGHYAKPLQVVLAIKERNAGKLDSHRWFFNAFAAQVMPTYTFLIDCGTAPRLDAIYKLYLRMEDNPRIGGICGEIEPMGVPTFEVLVAAQSFEYQMANFLMKSLESTFGFISVLPGAFSAYRFEAIFSRYGECPLTAYFRSITTPVSELGPFEANMFLAEDRVLCYELLASRGHNWLLHYEKGAKADTDVPPVSRARTQNARSRWRGVWYRG